MQFHAAAAHHFSRGRAARRPVAGVAQLRCRQLRRRRLRQLRRGRGRAGAGAGALSFGDGDTAAARRDLLKRRRLIMAVASMQGAQDDGRRRVVIEAVTPQIDCGRVAVKRTLGERIEVEADAFTDGHDLVTCVLLWRDAAEDQWREAPMQLLGNDRWRGDFLIERLGSYRYTVSAWIDHFASWRRELARRVDPADIASALHAGAALIERATARAAQQAGATLRPWAPRLRRGAGFRRALPAAHSSHRPP